MRKIFLGIWFITCTFAANISYAQDEKPSPAEEDVISVPTKHRGSATIRKDKTAYIAWEAVGLTFTPVMGIRAAYFITPDLLAEIAYAGSGTTDIKKNLFEIKGKYFLANSFYIDGGLGWEYWSAAYDVTAPDYTEPVELSGTTQTFGAEVHIGNQWQWEHFTMGCDWVGAFAAIVTTSSFEENSFVDQEDKKAEEEEFKDLTTGSSMHAVRLYLGTSF
ncbi:MAG: hypothetical protein AB7T49_13405 [Oligoflexales bacterium]